MASMPEVTARGGPKMFMFQTVVSADAPVMAPKAKANAVPITLAIETGKPIVLLPSTARFSSFLHVTNRVHTISRIERSLMVLSSPANLIAVIAQAESTIRQPGEWEARAGSVLRSLVSFSPTASPELFRRGPLVDLDCAGLDARDQLAAELGRVSNRIETPQKER